MAQWTERGNDYYHWEWDITCKDGSVKTVAWSNISGRFPIPGWATWGIGVDVNDGKQAIAALQEREAELKAQKNRLEELAAMKQPWQGYNRQRSRRGPPTPEILLNSVQFLCSISTRIHSEE